MAAKELKYKRVLLKLSGESLSGDAHTGIDVNILNYLTEEIKKVYDLGADIGIVIGGGNIYRGLSAQAQGIDAVTGDYMGMLATIINSLALQNSLEKAGMPTRLLSAIDMNKIAEPFLRRRAMRHFEKRRIVIFGAGTGNPYFTTDTAGALRALEICADVILKGTRVDGVYDSDPEKNKDAVLFENIKYELHIKHAFAVEVMEGDCRSLSGDDSLIYLEIEGAVVPFGKDSIVYHKAWSE